MSNSKLIKMHVGFARSSNRLAMLQAYDDAAQAAECRALRVQYMAIARQLKADACRC